MDPFFVLFVLSLKLQQLISRFLCEQFDCNPLIVHCDLGLPADTCPRQSIPDTSGSVLVFLNCIYKLVACLHIDLPRFHYFLENLRIFLCQLLHFTYIKAITKSEIAKKNKHKAIKRTYFFGQNPAVSSYHWSFSCYHCAQYSLLLPSSYLSTVWPPGVTYVCPNTSDAQARRRNCLSI